MLCCVVGEAPRYIADGALVLLGGFVLSIHSALLHSSATSPAPALMFRTHTVCVAVLGTMMIGGCFFEYTPSTSLCCED